MAKKGRPKGLPRYGGRVSLFTVEVQRTVVDNLRAGTSMRDAAGLAGVSEAAVYHWIAVGEAHEEGRDHPRMPKLLADRDGYARFASEVRNARAAGRRLAVEHVRRAGLPSWTHRRTGFKRYGTQPPPVTWLNLQTGEIDFEDDHSRDANWERQWSGEAWDHDPGTWQANAWLLERSDPENWNRRFVNVDQTSKIDMEADIDVTWNLLPEGAYRSDESDIEGLDEVDWNNPQELEDAN